MKEQRSSVINRVAELIAAVELGRPVRVGIDGRSAAGKSSFGDELAEAVRRSGRQVERASIDDFHRPGHKWRSIRGEWTPQTYCDEGYDYAAFRELVLDPLSTDGDRRIRPRLFSAFHDAPHPEEWVSLAEDAILIVDGSFLRHPDLADCWDCSIWLAIDFETMIERAKRRDIVWVGSAEVVESQYRVRWVPTHKLYEQLDHPEEHADIIIDNREIERPVVIRMERRNPPE